METTYFVCYSTPNERQMLKESLGFIANAPELVDLCTVNGVTFCSLVGCSAGQAMHYAMRGNCVLYKEHPWGELCQYDPFHVSDPEAFKYAECTETQ